MRPSYRDHCNVEPAGRIRLEAPEGGVPGSSDTISLQMACAVLDSNQRTWD